MTGAGSFTITRNPQNGLPESLTDGTCAVVRTPNGYGEFTGVSTTVNGTTMSWSTALDTAGRITGKTEVVGAITTTYGYAYDTLGHLATVTKNGLPDEDYTVDGNGRRSLETNASRGISGRVFAYDAEDRLTSAGNASYTYDEDGFLSTRTVGSDTTTYSYTRSGALKSVTLPDATLIEYVLDAGEQRIAKKVNGVITEKYLWAGLTGLLAVYDGANNLLARFEYADGPLPLKMVQGGATYYLAYDQVGSLRAVLSATGAVVHQVTYDSFGNILTETNSGLCIPFGFAGGLHDRATGLVRFGYRDYDPDTGRWTAKDPLGLAGGDTNFYAYCRGDSVNYADPTGELAFLIPGIIGGTIGGISGVIGAYMEGGPDWRGNAIRSGLIGFGSGFVGAYTGGPIGAGLIGLGANLGQQLWSNGGDIHKIDWGSAGISTLAGAIGGGVSRGASSLLRKPGLNWNPRPGAYNGGFFNSLRPPRNVYTNSLSTTAGGVTGAGLDVGGHRGYRPASGR